MFLSLLSLDIFFILISFGKRMDEDLKPIYAGGKPNSLHSLPVLIATYRSVALYLFGLFIIHMPKDWTARMTNTYVSIEACRKSTLKNPAYHDTNHRIHSSQSIISSKIPVYLIPVSKQARFDDAISG